MASPSEQNLMITQEVSMMVGSHLMQLFLVGASMGSTQPMEIFRLKETSFPCVEYQYFGSGKLEISDKDEMKLFKRLQD